MVLAGILPEGKNSQTCHVPFPLSNFPPLACLRATHRQAGARANETLRMFHVNESAKTA